jgi:hypothetical protein
MAKKPFSVPKVDKNPKVRERRVPPLTKRSNRKGTR